MSTYNKFSVLSVDNLENLQTTGRKKRSKSKSTSSNSTKNGNTPQQPMSPSQQLYVDQHSNYHMEQSNDPMGSLFGKVKNPSPEQRSNVPLEINTGQLMRAMDGSLYDESAKEETDFFENFVEPHLVDKLPEVYEDENFDTHSIGNYEDLSESSAFSPPSSYANEYAVSTLRRNYPIDYVPHKQQQQLQQQRYMSPQSFPHHVETRNRSRSGGSKTLTPLSPTRVPLHSISTAETLSKSLESLAENNNIPVSTLREWITFIKESDTNSDSSPKYVDENLHYLSFKEAFLKSQTIEKLVEKLLYTPQQYDAELLQLFDLCLVGSPEDHQRLMDLIKHLQRCVAGKQSTTFQKVSSILLIIINSLKRNDIQKSLQGSLQSTDTAIITKSEMLAKLSIGKQSSRAFSEKDLLYRELLQLYESKRLTLENYKVKATVQDDSLLDFRNMVSEIDALSNPYKDAPAEKRRQIEFDKGKAKRVAFDKIDQVDKTRNKLELDRQALLKEKAELEARLNKLNTQIQSVEFELQSTLDARSRVEKEYADQIQHLHMSETTFLGLLNIQREEKQTFACLQALVTLSNNIIEHNKNNTLEFVKKQLLFVMHLYVSQTVEHLEIQNQLLMLLLGKMSKYCEKIFAKKNQLENTTNPDEKPKLENAIKKYYIKYLQKATKAETILGNAEEINNTTHSIPGIQDIIKEKIDPQLENLSTLENYMLQFNSRLTWLQDEVYIQSLDSKECLQLDDSISDVSSTVSHDAHHHSGKFHKSNSSNNTMKISKSNNSVNSSQMGSPYSSLNGSITPRVYPDEVVAAEPVDQPPTIQISEKPILNKSLSTTNLPSQNVSSSVGNLLEVQEPSPRVENTSNASSSPTLPSEMIPQRTLQRSNSVVSSKSEANSTGSGSSGNSKGSKKKKQSFRSTTSEASKPHTK